MPAADSLMDAIFQAMNYSEQAKLAVLAEETVPFAAGAGVIVAPFLTFYGVAGVFMALGSGYQAATEEVRNENSLTGFTHGYVMGLLGLELAQCRQSLRATFRRSHQHHRCRKRCGSCQCL